MRTTNNNNDRRRSAQWILSENIPSSRFARTRERFPLETSERHHRRRQQKSHGPRTTTVVQQQLTRGLFSSVSHRRHENIRDGW